MMKRPLAFTTAQTSGFTLIEVLVVVIIAAILAGITAPGWLGFMNRQRVGAVRSDLLEAIKIAQQDAIQRRQSVTVKFSNANGRPTIEVNGLPQVLGSENSNPGNVQLTTYSVNTAGVKTNRDTISFNYRGLPTDPTVIPLVVSISADNAPAKQCVIVANLLGSLKTAQNEVCDNPKVAN